MATEHHIYLLDNGRSVAGRVFVCARCLFLSPIWSPVHVYFITRHLFLVRLPHSSRLSYGSCVLCSINVAGMNEACIPVFVAALKAVLTGTPSA